MTLSSGDGLIIFDRIEKTNIGHTAVRMGIWIEQALWDPVSMMELRESEDDIYIFVCGQFCSINRQEVRHTLSSTVSSADTLGLRQSNRTILAVYSICIPFTKRRIVLSIDLFPLSNSRCFIDLNQLEDAKWILRLNAVYWAVLPNEVYLYAETGSLNSRYFIPCNCPSPPNDDEEAVVSAFAAAVEAPDGKAP